RVQSHARIAGGERAVFENRIVKEVGGGHGHFHAVVLERLFEFAHNAITLLRRGVNRHQVIIVKIDTVSTQLAQAPDDPGGTQGWARGVAKRIASAIAHGPESKSEFVFRLWLISIGCHGILPRPDYSFINVIT